MDPAMFRVGELFAWAPLNPISEIVIINYVEVP
jgi:hypothetical protein